MYRCWRSTPGGLDAVRALVLPAVVLAGLLMPGLGPGVEVSPAGWELIPVAWGRHLD